MFLVKYLILFYDYAFILAPLPLSMYRHISLSKLHTPYVDMKWNEMKWNTDLAIWTDSDKPVCNELRPFQFAMAISRGFLRLNYHCVLPYFTNVVYRCKKGLTSLFWTIIILVFLVSYYTNHSLSYRKGLTILHEESTGFSLEVFVKWSKMHPEIKWKSFGKKTW